MAEITSHPDLSSNLNQQPQPGARRALVWLLLINMFNYIDRYVLAAVLVSIGNELFLSDTKKGSLTTFFLVSYLIASPVFGWLADRFPRWILVGVGVILWSLASGASGLAGTYTALLVTRMFVGIGEAAYGPSAPTIISDLYPVSVRGKVLSWFYMAIPVGSALGYALGGAAASLGNWRWGFYAVVPPGILLGILCFFLPEPQRGVADAVRTSRRAGWGDYLLLLRNRSFVLNTLGMAALTFSIGGISQWMPNYVQAFRHWGNEGSVNLIFGAMTVVTGITATLLGGIAGDRLRERVRGAYFVVSAAGLLMAFPFFVLMLFVPFPWAWIFVFLAEFCLFFNTGPSNTALANVTHPAIRASAFAVNIFVIHALGDAISPTIIGFLSDITGKNLNVGFGAVGIIMLAGAGFWLWGAKYLDRDTETAPHQLDGPRGFDVISPVDQPQ